MLTLAVALAMTTLLYPATANEPGVFVLTNAEKASGFATMAECEQALGGSAEDQDTELADQRAGSRGSLFNRNAGNTSRCEIVDGEPLIVVYPKGHETLPPPR